MLCYCKKKQTWVRGILCITFFSCLLCNNKCYPKCSLSLESSRGCRARGEMQSHRGEAEAEGG